MDVHEQAVAEAAGLSDRELRRGFHVACHHLREYLVLGEMDLALRAVDFIDVVLDEHNGRRCAEGAAS